MLLGFAIILGGLGLLMLLERKYPDQELKRVPGWWWRVLLINAGQLLMVLAGMHTYEKWFDASSHKLLRLGDHVSPAMGGLIAYLVNTWIFYWWHRARHEIYIFWVLFHQVHHSPQRIETITSFYKHPLEIFADSIMMTFLLYPVLGLTTASSIWLSGFSAYGEFFYHMNLKTPRWVGYFFQRPESHRIHHYQNARTKCKNYSDCPWWDMLGGTYENPNYSDIPTGFLNDKETSLWSMLCFKDVLSKHGTIHNLIPRNKVIMYRIIPGLLLLIGCLQPIGYLFDLHGLRGFGTMTVTSPLPLVFSSYNGVETFSTEYVFTVTTTSGKTETIPMTRELYTDIINGPYNRRNVYGVLFSHGMFFKESQKPLIALRDRILHWGFCEKGIRLKTDEGEIKEIDVKATSKTVGEEMKEWHMRIECP